MHIHLPYLIFPWSFNEIRLVVSENSRGHEQYPIYSCRTHQRAITLGKIIEPEHAGDMRIHLWYLIFPWSFIEIRQAVSENLRGQERDGRTDARTHGRTDARTQNSSKGNNSWKNHRTRTRRWYAHPPSILNIPMKFQWNPTSSFREFAWTRTVPYIFMQNSSKGNNSWKNHRTRTRRWYAHPPLILNIPMKFHWNPTSSFREFAWTRAGRTHGRTDARTKRRLYAPPKFFGEHNKRACEWFTGCIYTHQ